MLHQHSGSYYEDYRRAKGTKDASFKNQRLLTDRAAYISFLEVQLERVSAACMTTQGFADRIEAMQSEIVTIDSKTVNISRAVKLTQELSERIGAEAARAVLERARARQALSLSAA